MSTHATAKEDDPGMCLGLMCCAFLDDTTDAPRAGVSSRLPHHSREKSVMGTGSFDDSNTFSAETSLAGDDEDDDYRSMPHSPPLASIEALEVDDALFQDEDDDGEESLAAGLEDAVQKVMAGRRSTKSRKNDDTNNATGDGDGAAGNTKDERGQRMPSLSKSKKKTASGAASSLTRSLSKRSSALMNRTVSTRRQSRRSDNTAVHVETSSSGNDMNQNDGGKDEHEATNIGRDIDAVVLDQEETANARSLHTRERSADQRYVIEYVRSCDADSDADVEAASYNAQKEGVVVPLDTGTSASLAATNTETAEENVRIPLQEEGSISNDVLEETDGRGPPIEVVLDESDDEEATSIPTDTERSTETKTKGSSTGRSRSKVASTLKRSVGSLRRVGSKALQRTRSKGETTTDYCINQDVIKTLQLDDSMLTSPDTSTSYDLAKLDGDSSDDESSSLDETSSAQLRRRVVETETRIQSQIKQAQSFDSQQSAYALVHRSASDHRGIRSGGGDAERGQVIVDLGGYDGIITGGGKLETSDEVKLFKGMPLFIEQGIYDTVIPARSVDENSVVFIEAPATDPVSSGLVAPSSFDSDGDEDDDGDNSYREEEDSAIRKKKRRPLAFLRKKQMGTAGLDEH